MNRPIQISFSEDELYLLVSSLNDQMESLTEAYRRSDYFYRAYADEYRKNKSEKNMVFLMGRMYHVDCLKSRLLSHMRFHIDM